MSDTDPAAAEQARLARLANLLFGAARQGDTALLREAMAGGAPPDLTNQNGDSLVMLAAYHGHAESVRVLLEAGAAVDQVNDRGQTPLSGATFKGFAEVVATLLEFGADPGAGTPPPVSVAVVFGREDLLALFEARAARGVAGPSDGDDRGDGGRGGAPDDAGAV
jgi:ankyrin repeat protein